MKVTQILAQLAGAEVIVFADGDKIKLRHDQPLDESLLESVRNYKPEILNYLNQPNYTLWFYQIVGQKGFTQMGLMTPDHRQAQLQLEAIYDRLIINLQRRH